MAKTKTVRKCVCSWCMCPAQWIVFMPSKIALWHACMECEKCSNRYLCERGDSGKNPRSLQPNTIFLFGFILCHPIDTERERFCVCSACVFVIGRFSRIGTGICGSYSVLLLGNVEEIFIQWLEIERIVIFDDDQNRLLFCRIACESSLFYMLNINQFRKQMVCSFRHRK